MYIGDCIAYTDAKLSVKSCEELPRLGIEFPDGSEVAFIISRGQLAKLLEDGEWWITKNPEPNE